MAAGLLSLNDRAMRVAEELARRAGELGAAVRQVAGARVIDAGVEVRGSLGAGLLLARACLADLGQVTLVPGEIAGAGDAPPAPVPWVAVEVSQPVAACMASQYAGWQIQEGKFFAMGSGPMRAAWGGEALFDQIGLRERVKVAVGVLETGKLPGPEVVGLISGKTKVAPERLTLLCARTASLAGGVQVVARSVETALHKLHELKFDLRRVVGGYGAAPLPPVAKNDLAAIGRTNDAMLYGARVTLFVTGDDATLEEAAAKLPASASRDYGRPFAEIFASYGHDFYRIDPLLFSPAQVSLQNLETGRTFTFGKMNHELLRRSFYG